MDGMDSIEPVGQFHYQGPITGTPVISEIVAGVHNEKIGNGLITPLEPHIDVRVFNLFIVLHKG
jgi:hypothetical protein